MPLLLLMMSIRSQSHEAKVPGTRYICALETFQGQWFLRLKLADHIEAEMPLYKLSRRTIHEGIGALLAQQQIPVNELIHESLTHQIVSQLGPLLKDDRRGAAAQEPSTDLKNDFEERILQLEKRITTLEERIEALEKRQQASE